MVQLVQASMVSLGGTAAASFRYHRVWDSTSGGKWGLILFQDRAQKQDSLLNAPKSSSKDKVWTFGDPGSDTWSSGEEA